MDPNEALARARDASTRVVAILDKTEDPEMELEQAANDLAEAFQALDTWLSQGGFKPLAWENFGGLKTP